MFELHRAGERSYYINCPAKIGVYRTGGADVYLIDSGNDKDAGRRVRRILDENGWKLKGIVNTHSHADHIGGNKYLARQTGCKIFAPGIEAAFAKYPILEPSFLYGGYPFAALRHKFLMAEASDALDISDGCLPEELEIIPLRGHFFDMIGVRTPDDVVFLADCVSGAGTLEKYKIPYIFDVAEYLRTLDRVEEMEAAMFVPAHADAVRDIREAVRLNRRRVFEVAEKIRSLISSPLGFDMLLKRVFDEYGLTMSFEQYVLVGSTVRSYLSWMKDGGEADAVIEDNMLRWVSVSAQK